MGRMVDSWGICQVTGIFCESILQQQQEIEMGCGAACGIQTPSSNKYPIYSQAKIQQLFPKIKICRPLLTEQAFHKFSQLLKSPQNQYILRASERVGTDEDIEAQIMEKWKIILYGLDKDDANYKKCLSFQVRNEKQQVTNSQNLINSSSLIQDRSYHQLKPNTQYHQCFTQIEKDLNRTFQFQQQKKKIFQNILKRISNYFPSMGYTQGVNFVVGYLLIVGYSQSDTFWMFSHLALNHRYLILGLYEDGFPLAYIYTSIFKSMLKRLDPKLHDHLYSRLMMDESMWIFKWFITYYIYSFPFNTIKYIWNLVIELGGIALVYYALALVMHIREQLLQIEDPCDVSEFLQQLKDLNRFNQLVRMNQIISKVYELKINQLDLAGVDQLKPSFYKMYYQHFFEAEPGVADPKANERIEMRQSKRSLISDQLKGWYQKIIAQRIEFQSNSVQKQRGADLPDLLQNQYQDLQKSIQLLEEKIMQNESNKINKAQPSTCADYFGDLIREEPFTVELRDQNPLQTTDPSFRSRNITKMSYDMEEQINEVDGESDSNSEEVEEASSRHNQPDQPAESIDVQEDIFDKKKKEGRNKVDMNFALKVNTIVGQMDPRRRAMKQAGAKANDLKIVAQAKRTGLALAAQNILCNLSVANSQYSSSSSKNASFRPKKSKQNNLARYNKNGKVKTEQISQPSVDPSSSRESSLDHNTDKQSLSVKTHRENPYEERPSIILNHVSYDRRTQQDLMINSQGPNKLYDGANPSKQTSSQIEIFNGDGLFKKKKKFYNRNSNIISINGNIGKSTQQIDELECYSKRTVNDRIKNLDSHESQSIDSIICKLSTVKTSQNYEQEVDSMMYEIQSIK